MSGGRDRNATDLVLEWGRARTRKCNEEFASGPPSEGYDHTCGDLTASSPRFGSAGKRICIVAPVTW